jgi:1,2-phenylacetyl-CoA epoxidase catalytic subunit
MRKKIEWQWEALDEKTWRAKVMGGWLIKCLEGKAISCIFISDRDLEWCIIPPHIKPQSPQKNEIFNFKS